MKKIVVSEYFVRLIWKRRDILRVYFLCQSLHISWSAYPCGQGKELVMIPKAFSTPEILIAPMKWSHLFSFNYLSPTLSRIMMSTEDKLAHIHEHQELKGEISIGNIFIFSKQ